jgi:hypothetical protein
MGVRQDIELLDNLAAVKASTVLFQGFWQFQTLFHLSLILRLTLLASTLYKINQRLEVNLFERRLHTFHHTIARKQAPVLLGNKYSQAEYKVFAAV